MLNREGTTSNLTLSIQQGAPRLSTRIRGSTFKVNGNNQNTLSASLSPGGKIVEGESLVNSFLSKKD